MCLKVRLLCELPPPAAHNYSTRSCLPCVHRNTRTHDAIVLKEMCGGSHHNNRMGETNVRQSCLPHIRPGQAKPTYAQSNLIELQTVQNAQQFDGKHMFDSIKQC